MKYKFLVYDLETNYVLCKSQSLSIAHSVSLGILNSQSTILPAKDDVVDKINFEDLTQFYMTKQGKIYPVINVEISDRQITQKSLAVMRNEAHQAWESFCWTSANTNLTDYHSMAHAHAFLVPALDKCRPEEDYYTEPVVEWAQLSDVTPAVAYQELSIKTQAVGMQYIRNHAIYQKVVRDINLCFSVDDMYTAIDQGRNVLSKWSYA